MWTFSASSEPLLQRCVDGSANSAKESNKWTKVLQKYSINSNLSQKNQTILVEEIKDSTQNIPVIDLIEDAEKSQPEISENHKILCQAIETDLNMNFNDLVQECSRKNMLFELLATSLTDATIEKLCHKIYNSTEDLNDNFTKGYLEIFLPTLLLKRQTINNIDILNRASKYFPEHFKTLLLFLFQNTCISSNILHNFVTTLTKTAKTELLQVISEIRLSSAQFTHHLPSLLALYKDCEMSSCVSNYLFSNLEQFHEDCSDDKNFGRLLLAYTQGPGTSAANLKALEKIIENHRSPFRRPCLTKLKELKQNIVTHDFTQ